MNVQPEGTSTGRDAIIGRLPGDPPFGMPEAQAETCATVRDMLYLAAHDSAFSQLTGLRLVEMLTHHAANEQVILLRRGEYPVAFGIWARMSEEALRKLMNKGYEALEAADLASGDKIVMVGICAPWRREDFDFIFTRSGNTLDDGSGEGGWYLVLPAVKNMRKRLTRFRRTSPTSGVLEEARL
ncbi:toxin-activating lysine-acyltransferase [Paracoccus suum]|uniref:RTX toxin-activating lysine-acyltransferase n=1 Tax=Paracoccus suum TaxID=2259340 RepID=A0A344PJH3_9RHOB|nr:toxin-activating lysine-acyltransferase [Paracoccus suum]AXC49528.1 toxin-activating lysine-acyltransferase [Paracoccus suum]